ncbi:SGNH/GDSL hydrolase family protein [Cytophaga aurantiaca]|uniref:SGNH/GDSL hydrolase family protein n=1 Tax=Cytophaga aurantiaca TaxID=29530 RepID=UPI00035EF75E|nr:SGNH/GDSL hydrolase family protein [Cytophaga aurantiaca]
MKKYTHILYTLAVCGSIVACKPTVEEPAVNKGSLDVSTYVAVGNSITSGYADNALYYDGQQVSYAKLISEQFARIGAGEFKQPLVDPTSVGIGASGGAKLILAPHADCLGNTSLAPVPAATSGDLSIFASNIYASSGPFNNMGVPGAKSITTIYPGYGNPANGFGNFNPFFTRMASNPASASMLSDAMLQSPTFFTLFIGSNDVLLYALAGGASDAITPTAGAAGTGFDASMDAIVATLTSGGAKGAIANVPDITSVPYFTTVPYNGLVLTSQLQVDGLNAAYAPLGITFHLGQNPFIIADAAAPGGKRQITSSEFVLLSVPQDSLKCKQWGSVKAIPNAYVLTASEISNIQTAVSNYNTKIKNLAATYGLAFVDVNKFLTQVETGVVYNGVTLSTTFVSGGAFSLDGVHLTPIGNAMLANEFLKAINATYGSTLPLVDATKYSGVKFP